MRLRTLPVSVAGVIAAAGYALHDGTFHIIPAVICLIFAILCQIASNFANEYYDYRAGRDAAGREGPRRGVTEGDITPAAMKRAVFATLGVAALFGLSLVYWGGWWLIAAGIAIGLGAMAYSAGPFPLSTHCLGEVAVIAFFGVVPVNLTYYVMSGTFTNGVLLGSLAIGLLGANVLIVNNTRDIPDDRRAGKHTLATAFGVRAMQALYLANALGALLLTGAAWRGGSINLFAVPLIVLMVAIRITVALGSLKGHRLNPYLGITSLLMLAYTVALAIRLATTCTQ